VSYRIRSKASVSGQFLDQMAFAQRAATAAVEFRAIAPAGSDHCNWDVLGTVCSWSASPVPWSVSRFGKAAQVFSPEPVHAPGLAVGGINAQHACQFTQGFWPPAQ